MSNLYLHSRVSKFDRDNDGKAERITTETFDKDGNLLSSANDSDADGAMDYRTTNTYDDNGNILSSIRDSDGNGIPDLITAKTYNSNGDLTSASYDSGADGTIDSVETKTYNSNGDITSESYGNGNGDLSQLITYEYNEDGKIISREDDSNPEGLKKRVRYNTYQYNGNSVLVREVYGQNYFNHQGLIDEDFSYQSIKTFEYDDSGNIVIEKHFGDEETEPSGSTIYSYEKDGSFIVTSGNADYSRTIGYDANGNVISVEMDLTYFGEGKDLYTREYDENNNIVSYTTDYGADGTIEEVTTLTHNTNTYSANLAPVFAEYEWYEGILNNFVTRIRDSGNDGKIDAIANNTFDVHGNIISHDSDHNVDGNIDYKVTFANTYKTESADSNGKDKELLIGSHENDFIRDFTGNRNIYGFGGHDSLYGGVGNNFIDGGSGHDRLKGDLGHDRLDGGHGNDTLYGNQGRDILAGGQGHDRLDGGYGNDTLHGNQGRDILAGGQGYDRLDGGYGNDVLYGNQHGDVLYGDYGNDRLNGGSGNDTLYGGRGKDTIQGGQGSDTLSGNHDSDTFVYANALDSSLDEPDVITDFTAGSDKLLLSFSPTAIISVNSLNEANTYFNGSSERVAFSATESILYVDSTAQGTADMAIALNNVTSLDVSDFV